MAIFGDLKILTLKLPLVDKLDYHFFFQKIFLVWVLGNSREIEIKIQVSELRLPQHERSYN